MSTLIHVQECTNKIIDAANALIGHCQVGYSTSSDEVAPTRRHLLALLAELQVLLFQPTDFIRHLATQIQILSCLQWLGDFQVLACIPLDGSVPIEDVSTIANVPEAQLRRVLHMTTIVGFLQEAQPGHIAHTSLSANFVTRPSYLDAALFLAETAAPAALHMQSATKRYGQSSNPSECAYSLAFNTAQSFQATCKQRPKLRRQFPSYFRYLSEGSDDNAVAIKLLGRLDWLQLGNARVVDVAAESVSFVLNLAELYPSLRFVIQMSEPVSLSNCDSVNSQLKERISVQQRNIGEPQVVKDAAVYMVRLMSPMWATSFAQLRTRILAELQAHLGVLSANPTAVLVLQMRVLPTKSAYPYIDEIARVLDLSLLQLGSDRSAEITDLLDLIDGVHNNDGGRLIVKKLCSHNSALVVLGVKYQAAPNRHR